MAHFAKLDENNIVLAVHVVNNDVITVNGVESEQVGIDFLTGLHGHTLWKQTSYNSNIRGKYAGKGDSYNAEEDIFVAPQPYPSWTRSGSYWNPPTPMPTTAGKFYYWSEDDLSWRERQ
jgi:hypothetical protein